MKMIHTQVARTCNITITSYLDLTSFLQKGRQNFVNSVSRAQTQLSRKHTHDSPSGDRGASPSFSGYYVILGKLHTLGSHFRPLHNGTIPFLNTGLTGLLWSMKRDDVVQVLCMLWSSIKARRLLKCSKQKSFFIQPTFIQSTFIQGASYQNPVPRYTSLVKKGPEITWF